MLCGYIVIFAGFANVIVLFVGFANVVTLIAGIAIWLFNIGFVVVHP